MNHCAVQQNAMAACDEMRSPFAAIMSDRRDPVFCPKPLRVSRFCGGDPVRPRRWQFGHHADPCDSKPPGADVLDLILTKGSYGDFEHQPGESQVTSSPPYFCSSPPSRSTNPLVFDARFGDEKATPLTPLPMLATPSAAAPRMGGCVRTKFCPKPAAVRIEGFDCLDRDGRRSSCGITAVA